jgi:succinate dehydrogenase / fumarate reductase cytochrome b subunit
MRFTGIHLMTYPGQAFSKVQAELMNPWALAFYFAGITAASWHFAYGLYLFAAKWGITVSTKSRKYFGVACTAIAVTLIAVGLLTLTAFRKQWANTPAEAPTQQKTLDSSGH